MIIHFSEELAKRLQNASSEERGQIDQAYRLIFSRPAREHETELVLEYAQQFGLANACRMLLNTNEFMFID